MSPDLEHCARSLLVCEKSSFLKEQSRHEVHVLQHSFNHKISLLIPDSGALPEELENLINDFSTYYLVRDLPVYRFLEENFLETVVKTGNFLALSYETQIDEDNVVACLPGGKLILSLDKDTYQQLGLEGKKSMYSQKKLMRYVVTIDLTDKSLLPGTKRYKQVLSSLKERVPLKMDFLLSKYYTEEPRDGALQNLLSQYKSEEHRPMFCTQKLKNLVCPTIHSSDMLGKYNSCTPEGFLEWLGAVNLNINNDNLAVSFLSTYACPEPCNPVKQALLCTVTGFIIPEDVYKLLQKLRQSFGRSLCTAWASLTVHGFMDCPVSWGLTEHGFFKGGENFYNFVCFENQDYWLHRSTGSQSGCPP